jgi:hypothetical protein
MYFRWQTDEPEGHLGKETFASVCSKLLIKDLELPALRIIDSDVYTSQSARNLGVIFDDQFKRHISSCVQSTNFHIRISSCTYIAFHSAPLLSAVTAL